MKSLRLRTVTLTLGVVLPLFLVSCSSVGPALKRGDAALARGDQYAAALAYLDALGLKPDHREALAKLAHVAEPAYERKLEMAERYKSNDDLEQAKSEYEELREFIQRLRQYNSLNFVPINVAEAIAEASQGAAEKHYVKAESLFDKADYRDAILAYKDALRLKKPYKDTISKIAESHYQIAVRQVELNRYRDAAKTYLASLESMSGYKDASERAANLFYSLGEHFLGLNQCRKAYEDLSEARRISSRIPGLSEKIADAENCAMTNIAFGFFENSTGRNLAGMNIGDFIFENIRSKTLEQSSQFIRMFDREQLGMLLREQNIGVDILSSESAVPSNLEGVDYLIFGKLNQVRQNRSGLSESPVQSSYDYKVSVPYTDKNGKRKTRTERREGTAYFTEFSDEITVNLSGAIRVVDVKTGGLIISYQIAENDGNTIRYLDEGRALHDLSTVILPNEVISLLRAPKELEDIDTVVKRMINRISTSMVNEILSSIDRTPRVMDPTSLQIENTSTPGSH